MGFQLQDLEEILEHDQWCFPKLTKQRCYTSGNSCWCICCSHYYTLWI